jgi:hypothetical protein
MKLCAAAASPVAKLPYELSSDEALQWGSVEALFIKLSHFYHALKTFD